MHWVLKLAEQRRNIHVSLLLRAMAYWLTCGQPS